jgi:hypothetical protein
MEPLGFYEYDFQASITIIKMVRKMFNQWDLISKPPYHQRMFLLVGKIFFTLKN